MEEENQTFYTDFNWFKHQLIKKSKTKPELQNICKHCHFFCIPILGNVSWGKETELTSGIQQEVIYFE